MEAGRGEEEWRRGAVNFESLYIYIRSERPVIYTSNELCVMF